MRSKRPHQEDRSQISDCQNFKVSPLATDLISENNEGDLYIPERKMSDFGATLFAGDSGALDSRCLCTTPRVFCKALL